VAIDSHAPSIERLKAAIVERGLSQRVSAIVGDMTRPEQPLGSFDLIWSEGALYNIGIRNALRICHGLLRPGGYLAFTDAVWRKENPPPEVKVSFDLDYPAMGWLDDDVAARQECGFQLAGHFTLPDEAWWDDFYTPMETRIADEAITPTRLKPRPYSINSPRSPKCTAAIPTATPMSSLWHDALSHSRGPR
jgi:SAM-dependent methyltransferase